METLRIGSRGSGVEILQTALNRAGYLNGIIDGVFGSMTMESVLRFQSAAGLIADGVVGTATWGALIPYLTGYIKHTVKIGDSIENLVTKHNTTIGAIATANPGLDLDDLVIGSVLTIPLGFSVVPTNISFTYELLSFCIDGLKARYPFMQTSIIGYSTHGRAIYSLIIGEGSNHVMYNASHHANEWITTPVLMHFSEQYASVYSGNGILLGCAAREMYQNSTIHIVPMVNPDGVDLVTGAIPPGSFSYESARAMNYLRLPFPSGWKANLNGVDINLNYPAGWEMAREIKFAQGYVAPGPRDFVGFAPLSEPESQAMVRLTRTYNFRLTLSYHTQGQVIFWRYLDMMPPDSLEIVRLLSRLSGYTYMETPQGSGYAGFKDWFIQDFNRPGYTIEAGIGTNPLPISQFDRIYRDNVGMLAFASMV